MNRWLIGCALLLSAGFTASAQDRGTILGTVTDAAGAAVPQAKIDVVEQNTNAKWSVTTNDTGRYDSPNMPLGQYKITVQKDGFATATSGVFQVTSQSNIRMDVKLQVASVSQSVDVNAQAEMIDTSTATFTESLTEKLIGELPLISFGQKADITAFLQYLPGAETTGGANGAPVDSQSQIMDGSQAATNEVFVDGAPASDGVFRGSIWENGGAIQHYGEFNAVANSFSAEYGRTGTFFYSVTVKSGTNKLHGSFYDNFVNTDLNARDFFTPTRQIYHQNGGGLTLGGPVYIPKVYNGKNRTFFFFGEDLFFSVGAQQGNLLTIPTSAMRTGDFSGYVNSAGVQIPIFDPASINAAGVRTQFQGNIIPANRINAVSKAIVGYMPQPDLPSGAANFYNRTGQNPKFNNFTETGKIDHGFSDKEKLAISYTDEYRPRTIVGLGWGKSNPLEGLQDQPLHSRTARVNLDSIFRPTLINHFTLGVDRYWNPSITSTYGQGWDAKLGITGLPYDTGEFPSISFTGGTNAPISISGSQYALLGSMRWTINENLTWVKGRHFVKFGGTWLYETLNDEKQAGANGVFNFNNQTTSQPTSASYASWGSPVASFLLGALNTATETGPVSESNRYPYYALFIQDEWHVSQKLSLSLGLRWDTNLPPHDKYNRLVNFSPTLLNPAAGNLPGAVEFAGSGPTTCNCTTNFVTNYNKSFAPRIGYAWQITPKLVMRSSFGIFYSAPSIETLSTQGTGVSYVAQSPDGYTPAYTWGTSSFPSFNQQYIESPSLLNGQAVTWYQPNFVREGEVLSWTSGFQYQLKSNTLLDLTYIGHHGTHLESSGIVNANVIPLSALSLGSLLTQNINSAAAVAAGIKAPYPTFATTNAQPTVGQALRPYPQFSAVTVGGAKAGMDRFGSLQGKVTKRFAEGLTLNASMAWSKHMTDIGSIQNWYNLYGETAPSTTTLPLDFKMTVAYDLPFGRGKHFMNTTNPVLNALGSGWQLVLFVERGSGYPLTITAANSLSNFGFTNKRANLVGGVPVLAKTDSSSFDPAVDHYINPAAFANPATYALGNTARTLSWLAGPGVSQENGSINKKFALFRERASMKLGADFTNPFNFVRWSNPVTNLSASNFGMIAASQQGRRIQINAQILF